ncbi:SWIM zinc finger family protein [Streptomyces sp. NBC_01341]|uniref:SWIM zinc finger family protein n=1 Tax=Streptomyces sp. NBC_01341 TaxID=2903831 RepID=UPI002E137B60|nr:SWIM zinc finger family protein [Streptomyces sp. NBC_01341]
MLLSQGEEPARTAGPGARRTVDEVLALAPDEASRDAVRVTGSEGLWSGAGTAGSGVVWGLRATEDGITHRTAAALNEGRYTCSCAPAEPPCPHALELLLLHAGDRPVLRRSAEPPAWVEEWLTGVRGGTAEAGAPGAPAGGGPAADDGAAGRARAARRRAARRAARITGGAQELEQRLTDLLRGGLAAAEDPADPLWEETAARMVDAQAPGLAHRVRELGEVPASGAGWPVRMLEECALLHLLDTAWLGLGGLPAPLAATVRTRVGLTASAEGPAVRDHWLVLAQYDVPDGRIVTRRIWLHGRACGRTALLLSYGAAGRAPDLTLPVGSVIDAEVTPYPGGGRLRGELGRRFGDPDADPSPPPGGTTADALAAYGRALRDDPWLDAWPSVLCDVIPAPSEEGWRLVGTDSAAVPVTGSALSRPGLWKLLSLSGGRPMTVFGECGHRGFEPLAAWPPDGSDGFGTRGPVALL